MTLTRFNVSSSLASSRIATNKKKIQSAHFKRHTCGYFNFLSNTFKTLKETIAYYVALKLYSHLFIVQWALRLHRGLIPGQPKDAKIYSCSRPLETYLGVVSTMDCASCCTVSGTLGN